MSLSDRFETTDGSRPDGRMPADVAAKHPLGAFAVLRGGDAFEGASSKDLADPAAARAAVDEKLDVRRNGAHRALVQRVKDDAARQLSGNAALSGRLRAAKPVVVDIVPEGREMARYGFPPQVYEGAAGLFWDQPTWTEAKIALRAEHLARDPVLVVHELAHAVFTIALTAAEQELVYKVLRPTWGDRASMDEAFAIYAEREFVDAFTDDDKRAPGVYGFTRRQWNEDHLFTRFARKLWWPKRPLAGPKLGGARAGGWAKWSGGR